jgi:hypothetical protein
LVMVGVAHSHKRDRFNLAGTLRDPGLGHRRADTQAQKSSMINLTKSIRLLRKYASRSLATNSFSPKYLAVDRRGRDLRRSEMQWHPERPIGLGQVQKYALALDLIRRSI